jgi:hypothetical protein
MNIYYIDNRYSHKYNLQNIANKGNLNSKQLSTEIINNKNFCREELSITVSDLISYIFNGITLYIENNNQLKGVINFDINVDTIIIYGLCVPLPSIGVGSKLINCVKKFASLNNCKNIKLSCYGNVVDFYKRNGFIVVSQNEFIDDSDNESYNEYEYDNDNESEKKIKYNMIYTINYGGKKKNKNFKKKTIKIRINKKNNKRKNNQSIKFK